MRIVLLGPPGAGKGTQARLLADKYNVAQISTGDLFRDNVKNGTEIGKQVEALLKAGKIVPDEITIKMVEERLQQSDCKNGFILDGFPRTVAQAEALEKMLSAKGIKLDGVVQITVNEDLLVERISGRFTCGCCNEGYHDKFKQPAHAGTCDKCGAVDQFKRRADDNEQTVRTRLEEYHAKTAPILPFYESRHMLKNVDGMAEMNAVTAQIEAALRGKNPPMGQKPPKNGTL